MTTHRTPTPLLFVALLLAPLLGACSTASPPRAILPDPPPLVAELEALYPEVRAQGLNTRIFSPESYWEVVLPLVDGGAGFAVEEVGRSAEGRPLRLVSWGDGSTRVLLWSQMHGDESTASMALADLFRFLGEHPDHPAAARIREGATLHLLPLMNPDGAARFQRRSAQGIDLNRDARALATPEAQVLRALRDRFEPDFGFNLHDQGLGWRVGNTGRMTAIALLAPPFNEAREVNAVRRRAMEVAAGIRVALEPYVGGHIAQWDDTFNPRAFGDLMTQWGTSTILIESGGWEGDPEKQFLRELNFIALVTALESIATGSYEGTPTELYEALPQNGGPWGDLLIRGAMLAVPGLPPIPADVLISFRDPLNERGGRFQEIGDLAEVNARETLDASGLYLVPMDEALERSELRGAATGVQIAPGAPAWFVLSRDPEGRDVVWEVRGDVEPAGARFP